MGGVESIDEDTGLGRDEEYLVRALCIGKGMH